MSPGYQPGDSGYDLVRKILQGITRLESSLVAAPAPAETMSTTVTVDNFPALQPVSVQNFPASQDVNVLNFPPSVSVNNFPASVSVNNFPALQPVSVQNFPASQNVSVQNFPAVQPVNVQNFPAGTSTEATLAALLAKFNKTPSFFPIAQGATGNTVIAAASPGNRHKVLGFVITAAGNATVQFFSGATAMTGLMDILARGNISVGPNPFVPTFQTAVGDSLNLTSTGSAARGFVVFLTEP